MTLLGACIPPEAKVTGLGGSDIIGNFWTMLVGEQSKARKTTAVEAAHELLYSVAPERARFTRGSYEAAFDSFKGQPSQLLLCREGGDFLMRTKGNSYQANWKPWLTDAFDGGGDKRDTKKGGMVEVPMFRVSLLSGINPEFLGQHAEESDWINGFLSRFCFLHCELERNIMEHMEDKHGARWEFLRSRLLQLKLYPHAPPCIGFEPDARDVYYQWSEEYAKRKIPGAPPGIHDRGPLFARKIALLLGWDLEIPQQGDPWKIPLQCLIPGIYMAEWHYQSLCEISSLIVTSPAMRMRRNVLQVLSAHAPGEWVAMGQICTEAKMLLTPVRQVLGTLVCERQVEELAIGKTDRFYRIHPEPGVFDLPTVALGASIPPIQFLPPG